MTPATQRWTRKEKTAMSVACLASLLVAASCLAAAPVTNVAAADVDGDGVAEICAAGDRELAAYGLQ